MTRKSKPPIAIYSALADATRCRIVEILLAGPIPVHTLAEAFSISRPAISRHLRVLKTAGLVAEVKKGRENLYALRPAKLNAATAWIGTIIAPAAAAAEEAAPQDEQQIQQAQQHIAPSFVPETAPPVEVPVTVAASALASEPAPASEPDAVPPALPAAKRQKVEKAAKQPQVARPELAINQMGFDF